MLYRVLLYQYVYTLYWAIVYGSIENKDYLVEPCVSDRVRCLRPQSNQYKESYIKLHDRSHTAANIHPRVPGKV